MAATLSKATHMIVHQRQALLRQLHEQLALQTRRVRKSSSLKAIHDSRVSARALRVVLKSLFKECQPTLLANLLFDLRDIGRALTDTREADVRRQQLAALIHRLPDEHARDGQQLLAMLDRSRAAARHALRETLRTAQWAAREQRIAEHINSGNLFALPRSSEGFALEQQALEKYLSDIRKRLKKKSSLKQKLHPLRIVVKHARYQRDALHGLGEPVDEAQSANLKKLQTALGDLHDTVQLSDWLAAQMEISPALTAALREHLGAKHDQYRARLEVLRDKLLQRGL